MGFLAPIGGLISGVTLSGLATGASVLGAGLSLVGGITGNKTLQKVGMGFGIAGGAGLAANWVRGATSITGGISKSSGLLNADNIDDILSKPLKGSGLSGRNGVDMGNIKSAEAFPDPTTFLNGSQGKASTDKINSNFDFDPEIEKSFWERANQTLTKYDPMMNIMGGMGQAYLMNEQMGLQKDLLNKRLGFEQQQVDLQKQAAQPIGYTYTPQSFTRKPLLLQNQ